MTMNSKLLIPLIALAFVIVMSLSTVNANQGVPTSISSLEANFTGFEAFLNDISNEVNLSTAAIESLQGNLTSNKSHIDDHHNERLVADAQIAGFDNRLTAIENKQFSNTMDTAIHTSTNGLVKVNGSDSFIFHGELCKISGKISIQILFGSDSLVRHLDNCVESTSGNLISLTSSTTETFAQGSLLVLHRNDAGIYEELYRELP